MPSATAWESRTGVVNVVRCTVPYERTTSSDFVVRGHLPNSLLSWSTILRFTVSAFFIISSSFPNHIPTRQFDISVYPSFSLLVSNA